MRRSIVLLVALALAIVGCSTPGSSSTWSYGPTLEPAASAGSAAPAAPAAPASAAPSASAPTAPSAGPSASATAAPAASAASGAPTGDATQLTIGTRAGDELEFEPDEVSVPSGAPVSITFQNLSALPHNLTFSEPINVATNVVVDPGASETIEFSAPVAGDYTFVCTIHPGMEGTLTVEAG